MRLHPALDLKSKIGSGKGYFAKKFCVFRAAAYPGFKPEKRQPRRFFSYDVNFRPNVLYRSCDYNIFRKEKCSKNVLSLNLFFFLKN